MTTQPLPAVGATATVTVTPNPPAHVSWLKKFGQEVLKVLGVVAKDAAPVAQIATNVAAPLAELALPQFAPEIEIAKSWVNKGLNLILLNESAFAAVGQASNGPAKFQAVLNGISQDLDAWVANDFPGGAELLKGETYLADKTAYLTNYINSTVAFLNSRNAASLNVAPTASATAAASAALAAVKAAQAAAPTTGA